MSCTGVLVPRRDAWSKIQSEEPPSPNTQHAARSESLVLLFVTLDYALLPPQTEQVVSNFFVSWNSCRLPGFVQACGLVINDATHWKSRVGTVLRSGSGPGSDLSLYHFLQNRVHSWFHSDEVRFRVEWAQKMGGLQPAKPCLLAIYFEVARTGYAATLLRSMRNG